MNKNDEWYTPDYWLDLAREVLGTIELDPASCLIANQRVRAENYFSEKSDGLTKEWKGKVWCNPPYSAVLIKKFTKKFFDEYEKGNITEGIMLTNSGTDTLWNQNICKGIQVYTIGRISFIQPDGTMKATGSRGQCFTYVGPNPNKFIEVFTRDNKCWCPNIGLIDNVY